MVQTHGYPRPQLERAEWICLNGQWDFALDHDARWAVPGDVRWNAQINVPFAPETAASGIGDTGYYLACWYRRTFDAPPLKPDERLILHFGAVDYAATVWVNERLIARHEGGYTPFKVDITRFLEQAGSQVVVVRAEDDPHDLAKPRGKQDWLLEPHSIWYPRTTGIWQTVWMERLPATSIQEVQWTSHLARWEIGLYAALEGVRREQLRLRVRLSAHNMLLSDDTYTVVGGQVHRRIALSDPGIDDYRNELLWNPIQPTLIQAQLQLWGARGELIDEARSYTAIREIALQGDRFVLNGRPTQLRMVLDQGYWPETGITAPDDDALRRDVELAKAMGFNGVRKHQKIEDPRYLYWADRLGLLVWEEMPSAYRFTRQSVERLQKEWIAALDRDMSHPCIVAWVPFNESWGVPNLPEIVEQRHYVQALYHLTKTLDPSRPVIGNDGWESVATDIVGIHDYDDRPEQIIERYKSQEIIGQLFTRERPGGRLLTLEGHAHTGQPIVLSEFGGIAFSDDPEATWGYTRSHTAEEFATEYEALLEAVRSLNLLAGFCYTQFADTYQESNGLLYADRTPKFPLDRMAQATRGPRTRRQEMQERQWRERMMRVQRKQEAARLQDGEADRSGVA
ncbi:MAG TPA: glycoside hydrolase family 2 TIM barrel-domain containing protein [Herpetosiphonaceae bacterium]